MILSCTHISKSFGDNIILDDCSFHINDNEKVALIGINGAGKSTLFKIIMGEESSDGGDVSFSKDKTVGYLSQYQDLSSDRSIYEEVKSVRSDLLEMEQTLISYENDMGVLSGDELTSLVSKHSRLEHNYSLLGGYSYKSEVEGVIRGMGFEDSDFERPISSLSGGQKTRVALCKLLVGKPDIILLDEPTNHLDMSSIKWLENYLLNYNGAVLIVSHDRYFLDKVVTRVIELERGKLMEYPGNYTDFAKKKAESRKAQLNLYIKQQKEIAHQQEVIDKLRSFKVERFYKRAQSREKALDKMDLVDKPMELSDNMKLTLTPAIESGNDVLTVTGLSKAYNQPLFSDLSFEIKKGEHVALIGDNGTGKTTILKIINSIVPADDGIVKLGTNVTVGYYDQEQQDLDNDKTLFDEISDAYPSLNNTKIRNTLAAFMFTGDDVYKLVGDLSGGEKGRLSLAKLMLSDANLIILDEPTNHLDMTSREILEQAINSYEGTLLYVSHDRYFINATAHRILELTGKTLINYLGNYDYYEEKCDELHAVYVGSSSSEKKEKKTSSAKQEYLERKADAARIRKMKNDISKIETQIHNREDRLNELDAMLEDPLVATNSAKLNEISKEQNKISAELDELMEQWENLLDELDELE